MMLAGWAHTLVTASLPGAPMPAHLEQEALCQVSGVTLTDRATPAHLLQEALCHLDVGLTLKRCSHISLLSRGSAVPHPWSALRGCLGPHHGGCCCLMAGILSFEASQGGSRCLESLQVQMHLALQGQSASCCSIS